MMTPEEKAALKAKMRVELEGPPPKPKAAVVEGQVVRDADVVVSKADPNADGKSREIRPRRPDPKWLRGDVFNLGVRYAGNDLVGYGTLDADGRARYVHVNERTEAPLVETDWDPIWGDR